MFLAHLCCCAKGPSRIGEIHYFICNQQTKIFLLFVFEEKEALVKFYNRKSGKCNLKTTWMLGFIFLLKIYSYIIEDIYILIIAINHVINLNHFRLHRIRKWITSRHSSFCICSEGILNQANWNKRIKMCKSISFLYAIWQEFANSTFGNIRIIFYD